MHGCITSKCQHVHLNMYHLKMYHPSSFSRQHVRKRWAKRGQGQYILLELTAPIVLKCGGLATKSSTTNPRGFEVALQWVKADLVIWVSVSRLHCCTQCCKLLTFFLTFAVGYWSKSFFVHHIHCCHDTTVEERHLLLLLLWMMGFVIL